MAGDAEVVKLQRHLCLLREEYVKLQSKLQDLEKKYNIVVAASGVVGDESFVSRLLKFVANLFEKDLYSDMTVTLDNSQIRVHRFVLAARSDYWGVPSLVDVDELDFTGISYDVGLALLKWVYTDQVDLQSGNIFILDLMKAASRFRLVALIDKCEKALISSVTVKNCIKFYTTADEIGAESLKFHCSELISSHWNDFTSDDFAHMSAPLLYRMFKMKTEYLLHTAIRTLRDDVVFLYLVDFNSQLPGKLNEVDSKGDLPLDLALLTKQESIAKTLIQHKANINATDKQGKTLLHKAIIRADEFSATFLIKHKASLNEITPIDRETPLHLVASFQTNSTDPEKARGIARIAKLLIDNGADPNIQDRTGSTALHRAVAGRNETVFHIILEHPNLDLELKNANGQTVLWYALQLAETYDNESFAGHLIQRGSQPDAVNPETGDSLLHLAARSKNEEAGLFLTRHGANPNHTNRKGENPLHTACSYGLSKLALALLQAGANPNQQTFSSDPMTALPGTEEEEETIPIYKQTPLHLCINNKHEHVITAFLDHKTCSLRSMDNRVIVPNFNIKDSEDNTALSLALLMGLHNVAEKLLTGGASINVINSEGLTLLHQAIIRQDVQSALFLIENGSDLSLRTRDNESPLQLAITRHLPQVVEALCVKGVDMNEVDEKGTCPLWMSLESGQEDIASILVKLNCDVDFWSEGPDGCYQTLLHRAIDENNDSVACFLIRSGCDVNCPRRPGPDGRGGEEARDLQSPLHLACAWGLERVVQTLIEHRANVNSKDVDGKTPIHVAITNQHPLIISLLLSHPELNLNIYDKQGFTPFAAAMVTKNNKAAQAILDREPGSAEQFDNKGRNFLHIAIQKSDIESVLFLISIHVNIHSRVKDAYNLAPIHLAVQTGSEIIVRNLLLAGANVNDLTPQKQTTLHLASICDHAAMCSILLENGVNYDAVDDNLNNALHLAVQKGNLATVRILLTESQINAEAINMRGQTPFHVLCQYGKENAAAIFELFMECMPNYPINKPDAEGNTGLLLAYMNGNGNLCRAIVKAGACLGSSNKHGISIFNYQVATKQLLFRLLDYLSQEPPWAEGDVCLECMAKFGITTRKHHCRHCGRLLCAKCSDRDVPILKYNLNKPVRVCDVCFDVLSLGSVP